MPQFVQNVIDLIPKFLVFAPSVLKILLVILKRAGNPTILKMLPEWAQTLIPELVAVIELILSQDPAVLNDVPAALKALHDMEPVSLTPSMTAAEIATAFPTNPA